MRSRSFKAVYKFGFVGIGVVAISLGMAGCESGSHASKGAQKGAVTGATAGAVGGLVSALVFGGDPVDRAARGAVYGGTTGAVAGGMSGSSRDKAEKKTKEQSRDNQIAQLKERIGEEAFAGLTALAECRYGDIMPHAGNAMQSDNPNHVVAGYWLEVLMYADQQNESKARSLFPEIIEKDWEIKNKNQAEEAMRDALTQLMDSREEYGKPRVCP